MGEINGRVCKSWYGQFVDALVIGKTYVREDGTQRNYVRFPVSPMCKSFGGGRGIGEDK